MTDKPSIESLLACVDALYRYEALSYNKAQDFRDALSELESLRAENEALRDKVALQERQFSEYVERSTDDQIHRLAALKQWIADLQSGMYINCIYCGHRYGPRDTTAPTVPDSPSKTMADALRDHIAACPKHPMSVITAERDAERARADALESKWLAVSASVDTLSDALKEIRDQHWIENCLDPQWAARIASAALDSTPSADLAALNAKREREMEEHDAKVREPLELRIEELNSKVAAMGVRAKLCYRWLETNQPDVFSRGLYAALGHTHESFKSLEREEAAAHDARIRREEREAAAVKVDELAALVRLLVHSIRKHSPDNETARKAMDYLRRHELQGSPLRTTILSPAPDAAKPNNQQEQP